jgi:hypothetical protein
MPDKIFTQIWMLQPTNIRRHLRVVFEIPRTGVTETRDNTIVSDGVTNVDLEAITKDKMAEYVGSPTTLEFSRLWNIVISKAKFELNPPTEIGLDTFSSDDIVESIKFCDTCNAKGPIKHKKTCPKTKPSKK